MKNFFFILSGLCCILMVLPLTAADIGFQLHRFLLDIHLLLPLGFGVLGVLFAFLGRANPIRNILIFVNIFTMAVYIWIYLSGFYGLREM